MSHACSYFNTATALRPQQLSRHHFQCTFPTGPHRLSPTPKLQLACFSHVFQPVELGVRVCTKLYVSCKCGYMSDGADRTDMYMHVGCKRQVGVAFFLPNRYAGLLFTFTLPGRTPLITASSSLAMDGRTTALMATVSPWAILASASPSLRAGKSRATPSPLTPAVVVVAAVPQWCLALPVVATQVVLHNLTVPRPTFSSSQASPLW